MTDFTPCLEPECTASAAPAGAPFFLGVTETDNEGHMRTSHGFFEWHCCWLGHRYMVELTSDELEIRTAPKEDDDDGS